MFDKEKYKDLLSKKDYTELDDFCRHISLKKEYEILKELYEEYGIFNGDNMNEEKTVDVVDRIIYLEKPKVIKERKRLIREIKIKRLKNNK